MICTKKSRKRMQSISILFVLVLMIFCIPVSAEEMETQKTVVETKVEKSSVPVSSLKVSKVEPYDKTAFTVINQNVPDFYISQIQTEPFVSFSSFDKLGRTRAGMACLSKDTLPTESRSQVGNITPSGWQNERYDDLIVNQYLYNRSHVIGYQLCGDNATPENLFTGTDYLNAESMLYFENIVADYLNKNTSNHVIYRVTPFYQEENLVADGVQMEAFSVEDFGKGVCFNVFVYNVQPGIAINYETGKSKVDENYVAGSAIGVAEAYGKMKDAEIVDFTMAAPAKPADSNAITDTAPEETNEVAPESITEAAPEPATDAEKEITYILNTNTRKFHYPNCTNVGDMKEKNKSEFYGTRDEAIAAGYKPCGRCHP